MQRLRLPVAVLAAACCGSCWTTPRPAAPHRDARIGLDVEEVTLANGLRVVVVPEPGVDEVAITVRYGVGSADDPPGREGTAHLVEHAMFEHVRAGEALFDYLEAHALERNGFTTLDATTYVERAAPAALGDMLEAEAARMELPCTAIPAASFERQREIVRDELHQNAPGREAADALQHAVFSAGHPYGHDRDETDGSLAAITQADACAFASTYYGPRNAVLVLSGRVSLATARPLLDRTVGRVQHDVQPHAVVAADPGSRRHTTLQAPVERTWVVLAWPLPDDPGRRARVRAIAEMAAVLVESRVNGLVTIAKLGAGAARQIAIEIAPSSDISPELAVDGAKYAVSFMSQWSATGLYEYAKSRAMYRLTTSLEHGLDRDTMLAEDVADGHDAGAAVRAALQGLGSMGQGEATDLAHAALDMSAAAVVTLQPSHGTRALSSLSSAFREGRRRKAEDPADAHRPAERTFATDVLARARSRTLANGLQVTLLPLSTMPAIDIRLVLPAGTADEPAGQRGIALVAADALHLPPEDDTDLMRFVQVGGRVDRDPELDHTVLSVTGLASNLDVLLEDLALTARNGDFAGEDVRQTANYLELASKIDPRDRAATEAWRAALYGSDHPYVHAGVWQHADHGALDLAALRRFRASHYLPAGATLVISGGFDPDDADHWIDYCFGSWTGKDAEAPARRARLRPLALAQAEDSSQVEVSIAFPVDPDARVPGRIAAQMIEEALADVREELAASYGLHARLVEKRLSMTIAVDGYVDAQRAGEVFALVRDRIAKLHDPSDDTASLFVSARRHVMTHLASFDTGAEALGDRSVHEVDLGMRPGIELQLAEDARVLTIERMAPVLGSLDLAHAAILLRGPRAAVEAGYAALGRTPSFIE